MSDFNNLRIFQRNTEKCILEIGIIIQLLRIKMSSTQDITDIVLAWMPLIIVFAMLGMVLGMMKKFGRF